MFFFILPVGVDYRARRYPMVTFTLMGICVVVYLVTLLLGLASGPAVDEWVFGNLWLTPAESQWWTYLTSLFVHAGFFHLAGNMVYLFLFGACVEDLIGRVRFVVFYLLCGVAADFAHIAVAPDHFASEIALGGASGAISGCIGGFLLLLAKTRIEFKWVFMFMLRFWNGEFFLPAWLVISFWFLEDFVSMVVTSAVKTGGGGVAFAAHVGGTLLGVSLMSVQKLWMKYHPEAEEEEEAELVVAPAAAPVVTRMAPPASAPVVRISTRKAAAPVAEELPTVYLLRGEEQSGPFTYAEISQMFAAQNLASDALYWQEGMPEWRSVEELRTPGS